MLTPRQKEIAETAGLALKSAAWVLRVTERKPFTGPVLVISERQNRESGRTRLKEHGSIYNSALRVCCHAIHLMLSRELDSFGRPAGLQDLIGHRTEYRGNIPLGDETGGKLALLFRLHPRVRNLERVELMAWRIERFTREEALYWVNRVTIPISAGDRRSVEWAKSGLRLMLAGQQKDVKAVRELLENLRKG